MANKYLHTFNDMHFVNIIARARRIILIYVNKSNVQNVNVIKHLQ